MPKISNSKNPLWVGGPCRVAEKTNITPLRTRVDAMFNIKVRNPIDPSPLRGPLFETRRQGPTLRNFAMPKVAEKTERLKVVQNKI